MSRRIVVLAVLLLVAVGCSPAPAATLQRTALTVGLGYIPSVQFAQFYRAQQRGYYSDAGLDVTFQHQIDPNLITLIGQGAVDIGLADGTSVIPAAGQDIPVRYAATIYARFPNVVMAGADSGITTAAGLAGHTVGIPGQYGSSWIMLQALLLSAGLTPDDIDIRNYPEFGQGVALRLAEVDAATGFRNNEPVQLAREGFATNLLTIDEITPLPGPGLTVGESTLATKRNALRAFVAATLRAMDEIEANPELGLDAAIAVVPELVDQRDAQRAILDSTIDMWESPYTGENGRGAIDTQAWETSIGFMRGLPISNIPADLTAAQLVTEDLLR